MKKNFKNFVLLTLLVSVMGTIGLMMLEYIMGAVGLYIFAVAVTGLFGLALALMQIIKRITL